MPGLAAEFHGPDEQIIESLTMESRSAIQVLMENPVDPAGMIDGAGRADANPADALFAATYQELRKLARFRLRGGGRNTVLDTTSLVHESYLRLAAAGRLRATDRAHFLRYAGCAMRSVIIDFVRQRQSGRRGGAAEPDYADHPGGRRSERRRTTDSTRA